MFSGAIMSKKQMIFASAIGLMLFLGACKTGGNTGGGAGSTDGTGTSTGGVGDSSAGSESTGITGEMGGGPVGSPTMTPTPSATNSP